MKKGKTPNFLSVSDPGGGGVLPYERLMGMTTAVKRLNRYFCFLLLGFHLPVRENGQRCINQLVNITIFPFFSKF